MAWRGLLRAFGLAVVPGPSHRLTTRVRGVAGVVSSSWEFGSVGELHANRRRVLPAHLERLWELRS